MFLVQVWYPFLCGDEAAFVVSNKEVESVEVLVFDSSREVLGDEMILFSTSHKIVELVDKFGSKFLEGSRTVHSTQKGVDVVLMGRNCLSFWKD